MHTPPASRCFALREAKIAANTAAWERGLKFLLSTQAADGTWRVKTRMQSPAEVSPPYFTTGFPYGKDEFLSYAGTSWAVMALLRTLPEPAAKLPTHRARPRALDTDGAFRHNRTTSQPAG